MSWLKQSFKFPGQHFKTDSFFISSSLIILHFTQIVFNISNIYIHTQINISGVLELLGNIQGVWTFRPLNRTKNICTPPCRYIWQQTVVFTQTAASHFTMMANTSPVSSSLLLLFIMRNNNFWDLFSLLSSLFSLLSSQTETAGVREMYYGDYQITFKML